MRAGFVKRIKVNKLDFSIRGLYQLQLNEFGFHENYKNMLVSSVRLKFQLERKLVKHLKLKIYTEPLWRIESRSNYLRRMRSCLGVTYDLTKNFNASLFYINQPQFYPRKRIDIFSVAVKYNLPKINRKNKKAIKEEI